MTQVPAQYAIYPVINASLNGTSAVLLVTAHSFIKRGQMAVHRVELSLPATDIPRLSVRSEYTAHRPW